MRWAKWTVMVVFLSCFSVAQFSTPVRAQVDLTGDFLAVVQTILAENCPLKIIQTGTTIELEMMCLLATDGIALGTIDPNTGVFTATGSCGHIGVDFGYPWSIEGVGSPDSYSIAGTFTCESVFLPIPDVPYSASRCGNDVIDAGEDCDDGNRTDGDGCTSTCEVVAPPPSELDCRGAEKSTLLIEDSFFDDDDKLIWKWRKGEATTQADFGVPTGSAEHVLTLYSGTTATLVVQTVVPADADKWKAIGDKGWKYKDKLAQADGIQKMILKGGDAGKAKVTVKGRETDLRDLPGGTLPLEEDDFPITLQLFNTETEECWESVFDADDVKRNETTKLKLRARS